MRRPAALALATALCLAALPAMAAAGSGDDRSITAGEPTAGREALGLRLGRSGVDR